VKTKQIVACAINIRFWRLNVVPIIDNKFGLHWKIWKMVTNPRPTSKSKLTGKHYFWDFTSIKFMVSIDKDTTTCYCKERTWHLSHSRMYSQKDVAHVI
jgi:hypothetical protein